jgi:hypothetical protein
MWTASLPVPLVLSEYPSHPINHQWLIECIKVGTSLVRLFDSFSKLLAVYLSGGDAQSSLVGKDFWQWGLSPSNSDIRWYIDYHSMWPSREF